MAKDLTDSAPNDLKLNGADCSKARAWIESTGNYELTAAYSTIFWPAFVRFENYVLREGFNEDSLREFEDITNCHTSAIEEAMNRIIIAAIHRHAVPTEEQARSLGHILKEIHSAKLQRDFPALRFEIAFNDQRGLSIDEYELSFWQSDMLA